MTDRSIWREHGTPLLPPLASGPLGSEPLKGQTVAVKDPCVIGPGAWLLQPAAAGPGHARDATPASRDAWRQATLRRAVMASAFGLPSCVIPGAASPPEGFALVGPPGTDHALIGAALAVAGS
jgi:hypothetical protein